jgi:hypothetical protein
MTSLGYCTRLSKPTLRSLNCLPQFAHRYWRQPCAVRSGRSLIAVDPYAGHYIAFNPDNEQSVSDTSDGAKADGTCATRTPASVL